uniref:Putative ovule protein n=1 Tax=Solanum chacoense TaxID=4108 RepID=A0A0V0HKL6_SOLCH
MNTHHMFLFFACMNCYLVLTSGIIFASVLLLLFEVCFVILEPKSIDVLILQIFTSAFVPTSSNSVSTVASDMLNHQNFS